MSHHASSDEGGSLLRVALSNLLSDSLILSCEPLRLFLCRDGLVRVCSEVPNARSFNAGVLPQTGASPAACDPCPATGVRAPEQGERRHSRRAPSHQLLNQQARGRLRAQHRPSGGPATLIIERSPPLTSFSLPFVLPDTPHFDQTPAGRQGHQALSRAGARIPPPARHVSPAWRCRRDGCRGCGCRHGFRCHGRVRRSRRHHSQGEQRSCWQQWQ